MFSTLRNRFGIPGVISVIALVFAMFGGAYAASNSSDGGKATASAKAKKGPRGPKGATGPAGPAGPAGPVGAKGDTGAAGSNGAPGTDGKSPEGTAFTGGKTVGSVTCTEGGVEYKGANTSLVCNGKKGAQGIQGEPGEPGPTCNATGECLLPPGATETGVYAAAISGGTPEVGGVSGTGSPFLWTSISFPLRIRESENSIPVKYMPPGTPPTAECPGSVTNAKAAPGNLCIYASAEENVFGIFPGNGDPTSGSEMRFIVEDVEKPSRVEGSWALTACPEGGC